MTFLDMRHTLARTKADLHKELTSLETKIDKSHTALHKDIKEIDRKLNLILERLDHLDEKQAK